MATEPADFTRIIQNHQPSGEFQPYAYYGEEEDVLTVYISDRPDYAKWLNSRVTVFLSLENDELVGVQIKGDQTSRSRSRV